MTWSEDTEVGLEEIEQEFDREIALLVDGNQVGAGRVHLQGGAAGGDLA